MTSARRAGSSSHLGFDCPQAGGGGGGDGGRKLSAPQEAAGRRRGEQRMALERARRPPPGTMMNARASRRSVSRGEAYDELADDVFFFDQRNVPRTVQHGLYFKAPPGPRAATAGPVCPSARGGGPSLKHPGRVFAAQSRRGRDRRHPTHGRQSSRTPGPHAPARPRTWPSRQFPCRCVPRLSTPGEAGALASFVHWNGNDAGDSQRDRFMHWGPLPKAPVGVAKDRICRHSASRAARSS